MTPLSGGLNLWELDYRLDKSQSPDMLNMYWRDGSLTSRPGQEYVYEPQAGDAYGDFCACYDRLWNGYIIAQKGTKLYRIEVLDDEHLGDHTVLLTGLTKEKGGSLFVFGDDLYYMNGHEYVKVHYENYTFSAALVSGYVPTVLMNVKPNGTGGDMYQPENRIASGKKILFTQAETPSATFQIPTGYFPIDSDTPVVIANGVTYTEKFEAPTSAGFPTSGDIRTIYLATSTNTYYHFYRSGGSSGYATADSTPESLTPYTGGVVQLSDVSALPTTGEATKLYHANAENSWWKWDSGAYVAVRSPLEYTYKVDRSTGLFTFYTAPAAGTENNVSITVFKANADAYNSIMQCKCATVYGADTTLAVVCGGPPAQPNAYFWSGNDAYGLNPEYFPFDYYNFAGNTDEYIVGFGKQQNMLIIFKEHSIGKTAFSSTTINERVFLEMPYYGVNDDIGCDLEGSIRLIGSNLVFANTYAGVYVLLDTSAAGENAVKRLSRNVNGDGLLKGLLVDLRAAQPNTVSSYDDRQCYWLVANGHAYLWDYTLSSYRVSEEKLSWFYFENIGANGWIRNVDKEYYFLSNGALSQFTQVFSDYGEPIPRRYVFATQFFGTYEVLKDVLKVIFAVRSDNDPAMTITYRTDYEERQDRTKIYAYSWHLVPRNLAHRSLKPIPYAYTAVRIPRCFHIRHFTLVLTNNTVNTGMSIVSAQIIYRYSREDR